MNKMMAAHGCIEGAQKISSLFRRSSPQGRRGGLLSAALLAISAVTFSLHRGPHLVLPDNSKTGSYFFMPPKGGRVALGGNKSFGSRVDGVVWNGDMVGPSRNKKPAGEAHPNNLIFSGWLLRGLCADLCVFARNSFFAIWPRTELVPKNNTLSLGRASSHRAIEVSAGPAGGRRM